MQETQVGFLSRKDPLEKEMATHSSIFFLQINNTNIYYRIIWLTFHILTLKERERERAENISPNWVLTNSAGNPMSQHI